MIDVKGFPLKTDVSEMTVGEFEKISNVMINDNFDNIEKYIQVMIALGVPENIIEDLDDDEFFGIIKSMTHQKEIPNDLVKSVEIEGYTYAAYEDTFKLKIKDLALIEKYQGDTIEFSKTLAVIFKRTDLSSTEHYTEAHIKHKAKLFSEQNCAQFYPYIIKIAENLSTKIKMIVDAQTTK